MLVANNIAVRYGSGALAIAGIDITVKPGSISAILGPNGAGKTTTLRAMSGFLKSETARLSEGRIMWNGEDVTGLEPHQMARLGIVAIPERNKIFANLSVFENLCALRINNKRSRQSGIERVVDMFPFLADRMKTSAGLLSGGQQQMLAIARGLLLEPQILMIDEMTLGLHPSIHGQLFDAARTIADSGTGVLVVDEGTTGAVTHADHVYVISGGRVRADGPSAEFRDLDILEGLYLAG
jgi:branched-chain amino acid transport system ATP-binding protein